MTLRKIALHLGLFIATVFSLNFAGIYIWAGKVNEAFDLSNYQLGLEYSISIIFILACHEFGHYFAARYHNLDVTLPYFIPVPYFLLFLNPFGTMGAFIKIKSPIKTKKILFDVGAAGPIAGFIATLMVFAYGLTHLPEKNFILSIHPDYFTNPENYTGGLAFGSNILIEILKTIFVNEQNVFFPPMNEIYHYPFLCAGWFGIFITVLNLVPIGQSDGGHITYSLFNTQSKKITYIFVIFFTLLGTVPIIFWIFEVNIVFGWVGWLIWPAIMLILNRFSVLHPSIDDNSEIGETRKIVGLIVLGFFLLGFSPTPIINGF